MTLLNKICLWVIALLISVCLFISVARADTDGTEIQVTAQPDRLIIQLGPQWAGVQFRLKTDEGLFPIPVVVDQSGVLKMELGGSSTYMLSCFGSEVTVPQLLEPALTTQEEPIQTSQPYISPPAANNSIPEHTPSEIKIPFRSLIVFAIGIITVSIALFEIWSFRKKKAYNSDDDENN